MKPFPFLWLCLLSALVQCREEHAIPSPCESPILLEDIRPGAGSLQKLPYRNGQLLRMSDQDGHSVEFRFGPLQTGQEYREDPIPCPEDSGRMQKVRYNILKLEMQGNTTDPGPLRSVSVSLRVLYNTQDPLANERAEMMVLKVSTKKNEADGMELIAIPLLIRNYPFQIPDPEILPSLRIGSRMYEQVYTGQLPEQKGLRAYFSLNEGLLRLQDSTGWTLTRTD